MTPDSTASSPPARHGRRLTDGSTLMGALHQHPLSGARGSCSSRAAAPADVCVSSRRCPAGIGSRATGCGSFGWLSCRSRQHEEWAWRTKERTATPGRPRDRRSRYIPRPRCSLPALNPYGVRTSQTVRVLDPVTAPDVAAAVERDFPESGDADHLRVTDASNGTRQVGDENEDDAGADGLQSAAEFAREHDPVSRASPRGHRLGIPVT